VSLRWPTALAVNPLDNSLYILDNGLVLKLTPDSRIITVAGRSPLCAPPVNSSTSLDEDSSSAAAVDSALEHVENLAFSPDGDLYLVESDGEAIRRLRLCDLYPSPMSSVPECAYAEIEYVIMRMYS